MGGPLISGWISDGSMEGHRLLASMVVAIEARFMVETVDQVDALSARADLFIKSAAWEMKVHHREGATEMPR